MMKPESEILQSVMATMPPAKSGPMLGGLSAIWRFPNGYGASVVCHQGSYGVELAVLDVHGRLTYDTPITDDVIGYIGSVGELRGLLRRIAELKS